MTRWHNLLVSMIAVAVGVLADLPAHAQNGSALRVTATLDAPSHVQAGATVRLELTVMTTTWFTQPPRLPAVDLPGVLVTPPSGQATLVRDTEGGVAYSGLRYTYVLSPTTTGTVHIPALGVTARVGPGNETATGSSDPLSLTVSAGIAEAASSADAQGVTVSQDFALTPDPLVTGGRVTRTVIQRVNGVQAMLLTAAPSAEVPGFKRYLREPEVTTLDDGRGGFVGGQRIDRTDYIALDAGTFSLPTITLRGRYSSTGQPIETVLPGRTLTVTPAPNAAPLFSLDEDLAKLRHGLRWVVPAQWFAWLALALPIALLWFTWPAWWRHCARAFNRLSERRVDARRVSEPWNWRAWQREARNASGTLSAFYRWLRLAAGTRDLRTAVSKLDTSSQAAATSALRKGFGRDQPAAGWRLDLAVASRQWRRVWRRRGVRPNANELPVTLNPSYSTEQRLRNARKESQI